MHLVSYRGPKQAGGVSSSLARAWDAEVGGNSLWWHLRDCNLQNCRGLDTEPEILAQIPAETIAGHYRYCNEFIWPIMHDLSQYARLVPPDKEHYRNFNEAFGWTITRTSRMQPASTLFINDYQLCLLPAFLQEVAGFRSMVFWHIPWPKEVPQEYVSHIAELANGLLSAEAIGFHTEEYAENFITFINRYLPAVRASHAHLLVNSTEGNDGKVYGRHRSARMLTYARAPRTKVMVAPLGIDFEHWTDLATQNGNTFSHPSLNGTPFILSVDRADYTKGVTDRLKAIDLFFEQHPEWRGRVTFAQICGKTRGGLQAFDNYWNECKRLQQELNDHWSTTNWQPLVWLEESFNSQQLALMYRNACMMLVNPVRDGMNLTAKEYIACQSNARPGVLALSEGAGAFHELGDYCIALEPNNPQQIADAVYRSLIMSTHERVWRMAMLKERLKSNPLDSWWSTFSSMIAPPIKGYIGTRYPRQTA